MYSLIPVSVRVLEEFTVEVVVWPAKLLEWFQTQRMNWLCKVDTNNERLPLTLFWASEHSTGYEWKDIWIQQNPSRSSFCSPCCTPIHFTTFSPFTRSETPSCQLTEDIKRGPPCSWSVLNVGWFWYKRIGLSFYQPSTQWLMAFEDSWECNSLCKCQGWHLARPTVRHQEAPSLTVLVKLDGGWNCYGNLLW